MFIEKIFEIKNKHGLHARPSASFVKKANQFESQIVVRYNDHEANGKSVLGLLTLAVGAGSAVQVIANGKDANVAIKELGELINSGFNEE